MFAGSQGVSEAVDVQILPFQVFRQKYDMLSREFMRLQPSLWCTRSFNVKTNRSRPFIVKMVGLGTFYRFHDQLLTLKIRQVYLCDYHSHGHHFPCIEE